MRDSSYMSYYYTPSCCGDFNLKTSPNSAYLPNVLPQYTSLGINISDTGVQLHIQTMAPMYIVALGKKDAFDSVPEQPMNDQSGVCQQKQGQGYLVSMCMCTLL